MRRLAIHWLSAFIATMIAVSFLRIFPEGPEPVWQQAALFAAVLALINAIIRPVISLVTCPINLLTLGLFTLIINTFTFWLAAALSRQIEVPDFISAFLGALLVSVVGFVIDRLASQ